MDLFNMTTEQLKNELKKYQNLNEKELELFKSGKDFIDKAIDNEYGDAERAKIALWIYAIYKLKEKGMN